MNRRDVLVALVAMGALVWWLDRMPADANEQRRNLKDGVKLGGLAAAGWLVIA